MAAAAVHAAVAAVHSAVSASPDPFLAMGMVVAPFAVGRRDQVRATMLQYEPVLAGRIAFRFVVGDTMPLLAKAGRGADAKRRALRAEMTREGDIVELDALDGAGIEVACSCVEKLNSWVRYALATWPRAAFIGKTEDDTYVQLHVLEAELRALAGWPNLMFGYMTLGVLPTRPTLFPERYPARACVTAANQCEKSARAGKEAFTEGCFLGDLESKLHVPVYVPGVPRNASTLAPPHGQQRSPLLGWWAGASVKCGFPERHGPSARAKPRSTMAPFPTGPLAVFGRDLATSLFVRCPYTREYERRARAWGRRTNCKGPKAHLSFASTLCDTVVSHWLGMCDVDATVAHTTRTKSHHYMWRGAGLGWMPPSNLSLAVHYLKAKPEARSGPNLTVGGEWTHTHQMVASARGRAFPPLLYAFERGYSLNVSHERRLLTSLNPEVFHWCATERSSACTCTATAT